MTLNSATEKTKDILSRVLWIAVGVTVCSSVFLGGKMALDVQRAKSLTTQSVGLEKQLAQARTSSLPEVPASLPHGYATLRVLQSSVTQDAAKHQCQLTEFKTGTNIIPFVSKYHKDSPSGAWSQLDANFAILGRLRNVAETLQALNDIHLPLEVDSIDITREGFFEDGSARVSANVQLRAITQGAGS